MNDEVIDVKYSKKDGVHTISLSHTDIDEILRQFDPYFCEDLITALVDKLGLNTVE